MSHLRPKFIAYYRDSTDRQGESGLGLEAHRAAVAQFTHGASLPSEFLSNAVTAYPLQQSAPHLSRKTSS